jgi:hypothetical protein
LVAAAALGAVAGCATVGPPADAAQVEEFDRGDRPLERALADAPQGDDLPKLLSPAATPHLLQGRTG